MPRRSVAVLTLVALAAVGCADDGGDTTPPTTTTVVSPPSTTTTALAATTTQALPTTSVEPAPNAADLCAMAAPTTEPVTVESAELTEISGLAASRRHPGLLWAHNDSGDSPRLHLIDADTGADLGAWPLSGAGAFDWEDMAITTTADGDHQLYAADFGDNFRIRGDIRIYRIAEPLEVSTAGPLEADEFIFTYPDAATDAESLFIDPTTGDVIVIAKSWDDSPTRIFRGSADTRVETPTVLEHIGEVDLSEFHPLATAADITADGRVIGLRTVDEVLLWDRAEGVDIATAMSAVPCVAPSAVEPQGEALAFLPDGSGYITISEGTNPPIHGFAIGSAQ